MLYGWPEPSILVIPSGMNIAALSPAQQQLLHQ